MATQYNYSKSRCLECGKGSLNATISIGGTSRPSGHGAAERQPTMRGTGVMPMVPMANAACATRRKPCVSSKRWWQLPEIQDDSMLADRIGYSVGPPVGSGLLSMWFGDKYWRVWNSWIHSIAEDSILADNPLSQYVSEYVEPRLNTAGSFRRLMCVERHLRRTVRQRVAEPKLKQAGPGASLRPVPLAPD